ncbi:hypothetical protein L9F63_023705 [Diploptera punctata]|uniref:Uncharacterized protein n=1 Tax=Diploptera punctata TaxID=6984 RepID=A0AAD8E8Z3_DIPPU|nr:hypothetical protein L9F63_023705 [Diploptera punctata]
MATPGPKRRRFGQRWRRRHGGWRRLKRILRQEKKKQQLYEEASSSAVSSIQPKPKMAAESGVEMGKGRRRRRVKALFCFVRSFPARASFTSPPTATTTTTTTSSCEPTHPPSSHLLLFLSPLLLTLIPHSPP